ncbi:MAG: hypothetical protein HY814_07000 [Candidatus Riflebacteria bacterium]|nr:hypothetical protein [Candidatus Riflebacteria bacterium]
MRNSTRFARLVMALLLVAPWFFCAGCSNPFRVAVNANESGAQVAIDSPEFRLRTEGGPYGGRVDFDSPAASVHVAGNSIPRYPRYNYNQYPGPYAPDSSATPGTVYDPGKPGPAAPDSSATVVDEPGPWDYSTPLPEDSGTAAEREALSGDNSSGDVASSTGNPSAPQALDRFAQQQQAPVEQALRAKVDPVGLEEATNELAMFDQINQTRHQHDLGTVALDKTLDKVARKHSEEMDALSYFDHKSPVTTNHTLTNRLRNDGVAFRRASENIAKFPYKMGANVKLKGKNRLTAQTPQQLASDMMEGYLNSPGHRVNILDPQVTRVGLGTVIGKRFALNTQNFRD